MSMVKSQASGEKLLQATLHGSCYLDSAFFAQECRSIFAAEWFCAGRANELANDGDYRLHDLFGQSVLVVNGAGQLRAFYNVCRHRGAQLVSSADTAAREGCFRGGIRCPYHSWVYGTDGQLRQTPHLEVDRRGLNLHEIELQQWGGFYFLRLAPKEGALPLIESLQEIPGRIRRYPLDDLVVGKRIAYRVAANWKLILENYNECYHCAGVHPELCTIVPAFRKNGGSGLDWERGVPHREGANTFTFSGTTNRRPFPGLNDDEKLRHKGELIYPNLMLSLAMDHAAAFTLWPLATDSTEVVCEFLFHRDEVTRDDFDPSDTVEFWDITNRQDWAICESVQRGMNAMPFERGYYAPMEDMSLDIRNYVRQHIPDAP